MLEVVQDSIGSLMLGSQWEKEQPRIPVVD